MILPSLLFKLGELADLQALLHRGLIYMNSWAFLKDCERNVERDRNEGVQTWFNPSRSTLITGIPRFQTLPARVGTVGNPQLLQERSVKKVLRNLIERDRETELATNFRSNRMVGNHRDVLSP